MIQEAHFFKEAVTRDQLAELLRASKCQADEAALTRAHTELCTEINFFLSFGAEPTRDRLSTEISCAEKALTALDVVRSAIWNSPSGANDRSQLSAIVSHYEGVRVPRLEGYGRPEDPTHVTYANEFAQIVRDAHLADEAAVAEDEAIFRAARSLDLLILVIRRRLKQRKQTMTDVAACARGKRIQFSNQVRDDFIRNLAKIWSVVTGKKVIVSPQGRTAVFVSGVFERLREHLMGADCPMVRSQDDAERLRRLLLATCGAIGKVIGKMR